MKKGVIFATYSALIGRSASGGKYNTRLNQILHWLGPGFDGLVSFCDVCQCSLTSPICNRPIDYSFDSRNILAVRTYEYIDFPDFEGIRVTGAQRS